VNPALSWRDLLRPLDRHDELDEWMDDPDCDLATLNRTYAQFGIVNDLLSGWHHAWRTVLAPAAREATRERGHATLLDIGSGAGDLARRFAAWAAEDQIPLTVTGIDPDPRAIAFAKAKAIPPNVHYQTTTAEELESQDASFDLVVSNHVLHHLSADVVRGFLETSSQLTRKTMLHGDLHRSRLAIPAFWAFSLPFRGSYLREDGFRSILRAWTPDELKPLLPPDTTARRAGRFRLWVLRTEV